MEWRGWFRTPQKQPDVNIKDMNLEPGMLATVAIWVVLPVSFDLPVLHRLRLELLLPYGFVLQGICKNNLWWYCIKS